MNDEDRVSLREFILVQLKAVEGRFAEYRANMEERLVRTEKDLERRLESMNEFREQLREQTAGFITREAYEVKHVELQRRVDSIERTRNVREGQLALIGTLITLVLLILLHLWK